MLLQEKEKTIPLCSEEKCVEAFLTAKFWLHFVACFLSKNCSQKMKNGHLRKFDPETLLTVTNALQL